MASCPHASSSSLRPPRPSEPVYREECTLCFDSIDEAAGLDVCLHCFNGGCAGDRAHSALHAHHFGHPLAVNIRRTRKPKHRHSRGPPEEISKLEIKAETEESRYETRTEVKCFQCNASAISHEGQVEQAVQSVLKANTFAEKQEIKGWQLELRPCDHTFLLQQDESRQIASGELGHCNQCDLKENLWLCLTCGNLGCGRKQYGGAGPAGNGHQLEHANETKHPVAVKLGSLTAEGSADVYCYQHDDEVQDPKLPEHLLHWGINIKDRVKTEKSLAEAQLEHNLNCDFSMTDAEGRQLTPLFGPSLTGLKNLGNSCYLASVLQALFATPEFEKRYFRPNDPIPNLINPAEDIEVQLRKLADGLLSGRYSKPDTDITLNDEPDYKLHQKGIAPAMLKHLVGKGHPEFSTMRQQDSFELLLHLLKLVSRSQVSAQSEYEDVFDPVDAFRFSVEQRLQCLHCKKVRYRRDEMENISVAVPIRRLPQSQDTAMSNGDAVPSARGENGKAVEEREEFEPVTLKQCLDEFTAAEVVELTCGGCGNQGFLKQSLFRTFPTVLAVNARRFEIVNWVPTKQDVPVIVGDQAFDMEEYRSKGKQPDEEELPEEREAAGGASSRFVPNEAALEMLMGMDFPRVRCEKALKATGNSDVEVATDWLVEHMEDPDIDVPIDEPAAGGGSNSTVDPATIETLGGMGFSAPQARQALQETGGDVERAVDWLFSHPEATGDLDDKAPAANGAIDAKVTEDTKPALFQLQSIVCHKGSSIHAGHYVAFIKKKEGWVLFNDEKVCKGGDVDEMKKFAYIYFFRRREGQN